MCFMGLLMIMICCSFGSLMMVMGICIVYICEFV